MQQLTLMDAVGGLQQGLNWREARDDRAVERAEQEKVRATRDAAGKAFNTALEGERMRWVEGQKAQGIDAKPETFKPGQEHYFNAAHAASMEYAKAGDWRGFMDQQVKLAPMRLQARAQALQDFKLDGDMPRLVRRFYDTVQDGGAIAKAEMVDGAGPDGKTVAPMVRLHMGDGRVVMKPRDEMLKSMTMAIQDPAKAAERDAELALFAAKESVKTAGQIKLKRTEGEEARTTEGVKHSNRVQQIGLETAGRLQVEDRRTAGNLQEAGLRGGIETNNIRLRQGLQDAQPFTLNEGDTRYTVKDGKAVPVASVPKSSTSKRMTVPELLSAATHQFGELPQGSISGAKVGGPTPSAIAARANEIRNQNPKVPDDQALIQAAGEFGVKFPRPKASALGLSSASPANAGGGWSITRE